MAKDVSALELKSLGITFPFLAGAVALGWADSVRYLIPWRPPATVATLDVPDNVPGGFLASRA